MRLDTDAEVTERVREALAELGVSGAELARRVGVKQPYMARRLGGDVQWRVAELHDVAKALGVPVTRFLPEAAV
jgi:predicted transcriptional regulator